MSAKKQRQNLEMLKLMEDGSNPLQDLMGLVQLMNELKRLPQQQGQFDQEMGLKERGMGLQERELAEQSKYREGQLETGKAEIQQRGEYYKTSPLYTLLGLGLQGGYQDSPLGDIDTQGIADMLGLSGIVGGKKATKKPPKDMFGIPTSAIDQVKERQGVGLSGLLKQ